MLGDFSCRVLVNILGYLWPAYSTYKSLEARQEAAVESWCIYWLVLAIFATMERLILDWTVFWIPLYYEGKLLFVLWLWHPHTQGAQYVYRTILKPLLAKYEPVIDDSIAETQTWVIDNFWQYAQRGIQYLQANAHLALGQLQSLRSPEVTGKPPRGARSISTELLDRTASQDLHRPSHSRTSSGLESPQRNRYVSGYESPQRGRSTQAQGLRSPSPKRD